MGRVENFSPVILGSVVEWKTSFTDHRHEKYILNFSSPGFDHHLILQHSKSHDTRKTPGCNLSSKTQRESTNSRATTFKIPPPKPRTNCVLSTGSDVLDKSGPGHRRGHDCLSRFSGVQRPFTCVFGSCPLFVGKRAQRFLYAYHGHCSPYGCADYFSVSGSRSP